ncbi:molybdopterin dinucleotide binding domain-containing protein [Streptomyces goshikiensis]|uniref:molybdopterin dinucleotide binding domain-containing protein n=1 Tax=Streptomyces goshikiensis TaxID=1942 RepID=UPI00332BF948
MEISRADAAERSLEEGDLIEDSTQRGALRGRLRATDIRPGVLSVPFQYGYWNTEGGRRPGPGGSFGRAVNERTATACDPVSKQPLFMLSAAQVTLVGAPAAGPRGLALPRRLPLLHPGRVPATAGGSSAHATQWLDPTQDQ